MKKIALSLIVLCCISCAKKQVTDEQGLKSYIANPENKLVQEKKIKNINLKVQYRPTALFVAQELRALPNPDTNDIKRLKEKYSQYDYFAVSISSNGKEALYNASGDQADFSALLQTLSFRMDQYAHLITDKRDTIPVGDFFFPRTYGSTQASTLLFAFSGEKAKEATWLQFDLEEFGLGIGKHRFRFYTKDIENLPQLTFPN